MALVASSGFLFLASFTVYVTGFPLRNYLFGLSDESGQERIGRLASSKGTVKRELLGHSEFRRISPQDPLYKMDTLITSEDGSAVVRLDDGSEIELGPKTMVKQIGRAHV